MAKASGGGDGKVGRGGGGKARRGSTGTGDGASISGGVTGTGDGARISGGSSGTGEGATISGGSSGTGDGAASNVSRIISGISPKQAKVAAAAHHADAPADDRRYTEPSRIGLSGGGLSVSIGMGLSKVLGFALSI